MIDKKSCGAHPGGAVTSANVWYPKILPG